MTIIGVVNVIRGSKIPDLAVEIPEGVLRWRIKARQGTWALIYLKYADRTEEWYLGSNGLTLEPSMIKSVNKRI